MDPLEHPLVEDAEAVRDAQVRVVVEELVDRERLLPVADQRGRVGVSKRPRGRVLELDPGPSIACRVLSSSLAAVSVLMKLKFETRRFQRLVDQIWKMTTARPRIVVMWTMISSTLTDS